MTLTSQSETFVVVIYKLSPEGPELKEITSNVAMTIAMLEAHGSIIIDIIDIAHCPQ